MHILYRCLLCLQFAVVLAGCSPEVPFEVGTRQTYDFPGAEESADSGKQLFGSEDWGQFLGPHGNGSSVEKGVDPKRWKPHPPILWTTKLGTSYGAPAVSGGRVYQMDRHDESEGVVCYDADNGKELWRWMYAVIYRDSFGYNNGPRCSAVVAGEHVYLYGVTGQLSCVSVGTGKPLWTKNLNEEYGVIPNFFGVASTPCVHENLLLVMVGGSPAESQSLTTEQLQHVKPNGSAVVAFDKLTGDEVYRTGNDLASYSSVVVQQIGGKPVGLALARSGLLAWNPATGQERFQYPWRAAEVNSVNASVPIVDADRVFISEAYERGSVLLDLQSGQPEVVWKDAKPRRNANSFRAHWATPVLIDGFLYGGNGRNQGDCDFRCVDFSTGELKWKFWRHERSSVLAVDGFLVALGESGTLKLLKPNPDELEEIHSVDLNSIVDPVDGEALLRSPCWAAPVLSGGKLFLRGKNRLVCLELIAN